MTWQFDPYQMQVEFSAKHLGMLAVMRDGEFNDPGMMGHRIAYSAEGEINRKDDGLTFDMVLDGRWIVSNEIKLNVEFEIAEKKDEVAATA